MANQHQRTQGAPIHGAKTPAATRIISEPAERMPPRMASPWGQKSLDYAQSEEDAQRPGAGAERAVALT